MTGDDVDDHVPDLAHVRCEPSSLPGDRDACLWIASLAEVFPDASPVLGAELSLERVEEPGAPHLVAAARAEHRPDQAADGDDVRPRPAGQRETGFAVLRVDPGDVRVDDPDRASPRLPSRPEQVELSREGRLRPGTRPERALPRARGRTDRRPARRARRSGRGRGRAPSGAGDPRRSPSLPRRPRPRPSTPLTCGTPQRSRVMVRPLRGRSTLRARSPGASPSVSRLKKRRRSASVTLPPQRASGPRTARSGRSSSS